MASVNKQSLREEFEALKAQFERLCAAGKVSAESRALFQALLMLFQVLMAVFMEKNTPKHSGNSGLPPSQTSKGDATASRPGAKGKGAVASDTLTANTRTRETVQIAPVDSCTTCGQDLRREAVTGTERRTRIDIIFEKVVTHIDAQQLLSLPAMHVDETSLRVARQNHWIHVYCAGDITLKCLHPRRGGEAMEDIGITATSEGQTRPGGQVRCPQSVGAVQALRRCRPPLCPAAPRHLHQQPC